MTETLAQLPQAVAPVSDYSLGAAAVAAVLGLMIVFGMSKALSELGQLFNPTTLWYRVMHGSEWLRTAVAASLVALLVGFILSRIAVRGEFVSAEWYALWAFVGGVLSPLVLERLVGMVLGAVARRLGGTVPPDPNATGPRLRIPDKTDIPPEP